MDSPVCHGEFQSRRPSRADVKATRALYAAAPKGACDFPNSENATLA
jgi:hypothetical protein